MNRKNSGYIVETKLGKIARTYHSKGMVNGKVPVYIASEVTEIEGGFKYPVKFEETATLCDPSTLKQIGFID